MYKMVTYEYLKQIENDSLFVMLLQKGLISLSILDRKCYYEKYLQELKKVEKAQAIYNASEEFKVSEMTIRRAINFMEN